MLVHGDDYVAVGERDEIGNFRKQVANRFTVKDKIVGMRTDLGEVVETRILNRIVRVTKDGLGVCSRSKARGLDHQGAGTRESKGNKDSRRG